MRMQGRGARGVRQAAGRAGGRARRAAGRARCWCVSSRAASATPTSTRPPASTRPATRRPCSATRARASSSGSARASTRSRSATTSSRCSRRSAGECVHCRSPLTNLCLAIREQQNLGYLPDGTTRLRRDGEPMRHFMGTSTFAQYTVMPEIALAKIDPEAPLEAACLFACGLSTGLGAAMRTAAVRAGLDLRRLRRRHGRARRGRRLPAAGRRADRLRRPLAGAARAGARPGRDRHARRRPRHGRGDPRDDRRLRRRLHLRGDRQRRGDAPGGRGGADGLGAVHRRGRRRPRRDARHHPALPDHRPARLRLLVRRAEGPRRRARS